MCFHLSFEGTFSKSSYALGRLRTFRIHFTSLTQLFSSRFFIINCLSTISYSTESGLSKMFRNIFSVFFWIMCSTGKIPNSPRVTEFEHLLGSPWISPKHFLWKFSRFSKSVFANLWISNPYVSLGTTYVDHMYAQTVCFKPLPACNPAPINEYATFLAELIISSVFTLFEMSLCIPRCTVDSTDYIGFPCCLNSFSDVFPNFLRYVRIPLFFGCMM